jgi:hypothetical protein
MTDQTQASSTTGNDVRKLVVCGLDPKLADRLITLGFDPEAPVYEAVDCMILEGHYLSERRREMIGDNGYEDSMLEGVTQALSQRHPGPVVVSFMPEHSHEAKNPAWTVTVLIETMRVQYETDIRGRWLQGRPRIPEYYLRGFVTPSSAECSPEAPRANIYMNPRDGGPRGDKAYIQVVEEPAPSLASADTLEAVPA